MVAPQYTPALFKPIVTAMSAQLGFAVSYRWGHKKEVTRRLTQIDGAQLPRPQKYPLLWLVMDFQETKGADPKVYSEMSLNFVLATSTDPNYTEEDRKAKSFDPILLPMYAAFIDQIGQSSAFRQPYASGIKHTFILRPYWGDGNANIFNDTCDAIEIKNLQLQVRQVVPDCNALKLNLK